MYYAFEINAEKLLRYFYDIKCDNIKLVPSCNHYNNESNTKEKYCPECGKLNTVKKHIIYKAILKESLKDKFNLPIVLLSDNNKIELLKYITLNDGIIKNTLDIYVGIASTEVNWIKPYMNVADIYIWRYGERESKWDNVFDENFTSGLYCILGEFNCTNLQAETHNMKDKLRHFKILMELFNDVDEQFDGGYIDENLEIIML